ncbi:glycoside hydrolase family 2 protein [Chitinophaga sp. SYP-B3965]|uniref:glycosyl hydrolase n=1 Tax=Chitinophaga sp. SYP-B3965 TaxID=2663120 RepID=UPI001299C1DC|nr:glycosyl hydrolase [Chitinophaga sp. SYP-B3965]MRG47514.1 glycoside hydrolase family 2 protein [Chitinophaga sp. SYP-B3965]
MLLFVFETTTAQVKWPVITQSAKPWTRWWWEGSAVDKSGLTAAMAQYEKAGLGGLEITPIYGIKGKEQQFIPFLTPKWMEMLQFTLQEAKRLNLGIDMATGTGWPFGGPWVTDTDASKYLAFKKYTLVSGEQLEMKIVFLQEPIVRSANSKPLPKDLVLVEPIAANKDLQGLALDQVRFAKPLPLVSLIAYDEKGQFTDITYKVDAQGKLNWTAPYRVSLYALFQGWHGKMVERAAPGGEGLAIDHFSSPAIDHYLGHFDKAFAGSDLTGLRSFFNDSYEVDDARGQANWTPDLFDAFRKKRGYDLRNELPALLTVDSSEKHLRVLYDYRMTISELLLEKFTRPWHQWASAKGKLIRNQSHGSPSNILDLYDAIDIPETEGTDILRFKFATSTANVSGKPLASAEAATWLNEHFQSSLGDVKLAIDKYFVGGVNHIFYHGTNYSPQNEIWPGWLFYAAVHFTPANPFWKDFGALNSYVARCQSFLQLGKSDNDVLLYFPFHDRNSQPGREMLHHFDGMEGFHGSKFEEAGEELLEEGYTFDLISDLQLLKAKAVNGKIQTAGGGQYQTILLADVKYLPLETLDKLIELVKAGAKVVMYENLPQDVPGYFQLASRKAAFKKKLQELSSSKNAFLNNHLSELMKAAAVRQETFKHLQFVRRAYNNGHYYFISNTGKSPITDYIPLSSKAKGAALFDPMLDRKGVAMTKTGSDGKLQVYVTLEPGESCIIQTGVFGGEGFVYTKPVGDATLITGKWNLEFLSGGPTLPASTATHLGSWTTISETFSGTAQYSIRFKKPAGKADAWELNLGAVGESAEVFLNGKRLATLIGPVYKLTIPLLADNELRIVVTNGMANRIIDLDKRGVEWKKFYNTNMPARLPANRGADGLFTAKGWEPKASGLLGPVTLRPVNYIRK